VVVLESAVARIVALLTDFGTSDPYLGAMKGAVLAACPEATLVDLVHEVPPHDVLAGALALDAAWPPFPPGSVFLGVVDPGVGSPRRGLALAAAGHLFVGPDNGLFTLVLRGATAARVHAVENERLFRRPVSPVFHGRDVFGPVAGRLAAGLPLEEVGPPVGDPVRLELPEPRLLGDDGWEAAVLRVDRFGNLTTCLPAAVLGEAADRPGGLRVLVGDAAAPFVRTYADVPAGGLCSLVGSSGYLEVAVREGSAADRLGAVAGTAVRVFPGKD